MKEKGEIAMKIAKKILMFLIIFIVASCLCLILTRMIYQYNRKQELLYDTPVGKGEERIKQEEKRFEKIMKRYCPKEYQEKIDSNKENSNSGKLVNIQTSPLTEKDRQFYDAVLRILEEKKLNEKDTELVKDYIESQLIEIEKNETLKVRAHNVLGISKT